MYAKSTTIKNKTGLHARPAADFVAAAGKFQCRLNIRRANEEESANAKSIIRLLALGLSHGEEIELTGAGDDEKQAVDSLIALIDSGFGE